MTTITLPPECRDFNDLQTSDPDGPGFIPAPYFYLRKTLNRAQRRSLKDFQPLSTSPSSDKGLRHAQLLGSVFAEDRALRLDRRRILRGRTV